MPIDPHGSSARVLACFACLLLSGIEPLSGQGIPSAAAATGPSLLLIDTETRVSGVGFRFTSGSALPVRRLRRSIAYAGPGPVPGVRRTFGFLPGISAPELDRFSPLTLQKDVVRLRRLYGVAGFPDVSVDYDVTLDTASNQVDVTFLIDQGAPVAVGEVRTRLQVSSNPDDPDSDTLQTVTPRLPPTLERSWERHLGWLRSRRGRRFGQQERAQLQNETARWFFNRGYPWADVAVAREDTIGKTVDVELLVSTGRRARVREIAVEGRRRLSENVVRREIPIRIGDWYDSRRVAAGQTELYELDLVKRALGDVVEAQPHDSTVAIRFRIEEARPRLVWGRVGWRSEAGVAGEAHWLHRNFFGGARTFTVSTTVETGWAAVEQTRGRNVGASALVRQPYIGHRSISGTFGPFIRWQDDFRDRSLAFGVETAAMYRRTTFKTFTIQHELSKLRVDDALQLLTIREFVQDGPVPFDPVFIKSVFRVNTTYGRLDSPLDPRSGFLIQPTLQVTGPSRISDVEFLRLGLQLVAAIPLSDRTGLFLRASGGRLFPFADSDLREPDARVRALAGLRSVMFTAGGTADVRGWGVGLVGPKIPEVSVTSVGTGVAQRYVPVGGLARLTGSVELGLPFPLLSLRHRTYAFFDAGRVWSPGGLVVPADPELALDPWAFAVGGGLQFATLVGPIRIGVGYKLNPTRIDLLSPGDVARTLATGGDLSSLAVDNRRRWHIHFSIGRLLF